LRGPLTTLKGFLNLLTDNTEALAKTDIRQHANYIRNSLNNSLDLLDNTLYWSLMHTGNLQLEPATINLNELVCKTQRQYQLMADHKEIKLTMHADEKMSVKADESMITVVLRNIISNAIKFTKPGKQVDIHLSRKGDQAVVSVIDEGVGMNTYYLEKLLSDEMPFTHTGTVNEKGTGLGIVLCRHFMKMNNGTFTINSVEKAGTECIITLPLAGYA
jgi:K+-sensing histidine kinase KdpD